LVENVFTRTAGHTIVDAGSDGVRVHTFSATKAFLENIGKVSASSAVIQAILDCSNRILTKYYTVTAFGVLNARKQFNLVTLAVESKEEEELSTSF
jgi:hypothetical protein